MSAILTEIISNLTGGIQGIATGLGSGLQSLVTEMFLVTGEGGAMTLSVFGGLITIFSGIALAVGLSRLIFTWLTTLGN